MEPANSIGLAQRKRTRLITLGSDDRNIHSIFIIYYFLTGILNISPKENSKKNASLAQLVRAFGC